MEVYTDNGETGTKFDRPDFQRMMEDVRSGKINCIIVKDLSRFARDFREAGHYLEQIFPFLGVRFISINDHYDSSDPKPDKEGIAIPATNLINELYARDISQKVKSGLKTLRSAGKFVGALAPYGYNKSPRISTSLWWTLLQQRSFGIFSNGSWMAGATARSCII